MVPGSLPGKNPKKWRNRSQFILRSNCKKVDAKTRSKRQLTIFLGHNDTIELSSKLIKFKSITPDNSGAIDYIKNFKEKFNCHILSLGLTKLRIFMHHLKEARDQTLVLQVTLTLYLQVI